MFKDFSTGKGGNKITSGIQDIIWCISMDPHACREE